MDETVGYDHHGFKFRWSSEKARNNIEKRGVSFEVACQAVLNDVQLTEEQEDEEGEPRLAIISFPLSEASSAPLFVVVADDGDAWRIITARKATPTERKRYEEEIDSY